MIEKITDQNLERYDSRLKEWCDKKFFEKGNYGKYQTTEEANAVTFYPAPNTPLEGKVKFSFTETLPVSGDKGPENLSTISGVSSVKVTRRGKNLLTPTALTYSSRDGLTYTVNADGSVNVSGEASDSVYNNMTPINLPAGTYRLTGCPANGAPATYYLQVFGSPKLGVPIRDYGSGQTFTLTQKTIITTSILVYNGYNASITPLVFRPQIVAGSEALNYEQAESALTQTVSLGDTYYGGEIDLATGVMTVNRVVCELDGTEWWSSIGNDGHTLSAYNSSTGYGWSYCILRNISGGHEPILTRNSIQDSSIVSCTHFQTTNWGVGDGAINDGTVNYSAVFLTGAQCRFSFQYSDLADWKAYLAAQKTAGTPVKVAYLVDVPFTVQLDPIEILSLTQIDKYTPRLNTVYTDADSVQISYLKSPIRDEYEKTQAILSLGGNS